MQEIGKKLQTKRKELKLSYEDINLITKLPVEKIKAIEEGNLDYFQDELTYVRFYVRSYCKAVDVPYESFKDDVLESVDEFTNTMTIKKDQENIQIHKNVESKKPSVAKKDRSSIAKNLKGNHIKKVKKIDFAFVSLIIIIIIVLIILVYVGVNALINNQNSDQSSSVDKTEEKVDTTTPTPEKDSEDTTDETKKEEVSVALSATSTPTTYELSGVKEGDKVSFEVTFSQICFFDAYVNSVQIANGQTYQYLSADTAFKYETVAKANDVYLLQFGNFQNAKPVIKINGVTLDYGTTLSSAGDVVSITVNLKGE